MSKVIKDEMSVTYEMAFIGDLLACELQCLKIPEDIFGLQPEDFHDFKCRVAFNAIKEILKAGDTICKNNSEEIF